MSDLSTLFDDDEEEKVTASDEKETNPLKQARDHIKSLEKQLRQAQKDTAELREFKEKVESEKRENSLSEAFKAAGLNVKHAKLYLKVTEGEADPEAIKAFAEEYELPVGEPSGEVADVSAPKPFSPMTNMGVPATKKRYTTVEIENLVKQGLQAEADAAIREGRVDIVKSIEADSARWEEERQAS